jgi:hypothetical protein
MDTVKLLNKLPADITAAQSLTVFPRQFNTSLFRHSYPDFTNNSSLLLGVLSQSRLN